VSTSSPTADDAVTWSARHGLAELRSYRELFVNLLLRDLRSKYKRTVLGWGWSMINPLVQVVVFTFVFRLIFRAAPPPGANGVDSFPVWILCGLLAWNYFVISVNAGIASLTDNANLVQKTYFPRVLLVGSATLAQVVTLLIELGILSLILVVVGIIPLLWLPMALVLVVLLAALSTGLALLLSVTNVYFRDTSHLMGLVFQMWFYATPVIYPYQQLLENVDLPWLVRLYQLNPMFHVVEGFRDVLYYQEMPPAGSLAYLTGAAVVALVGGWWVFQRFEPRMAEEL
jgi:ABC-2 type transport system permease protein